MAEEKQSSKWGSLRDILVGLLSSEPSVEELPIDEEAPWLTGYRPLVPSPSPSPSPMPTPTPAPTPVPALTPEEVALVEEDLRERRRKMLPLQYIANPPKR